MKKYISNHGKNLNETQPAAGTKSGCSRGKNKQPAPPPIVDEWKICVFVILSLVSNDRSRWVRRRPGSLATLPWSPLLLARGSRWLPVNRCACTFPHTPPAAAETTRVFCTHVRVPFFFLFLSSFCYHYSTPVYRFCTADEHCNWRMWKTIKMRKEKWKKKINNNRPRVKYFCFFFSRAHFHLHNQGWQLPRELVYKTAHSRVEGKLFLVKHQRCLKLGFSLLCSTRKLN